MTDREEVTSTASATASPPSAAGPIGGYGLDLPPGLELRETQGGSTDSAALAALLLGVGSCALVGCCWPVSPLLSMGAIVSGIVAMQRTARAGAGRGVAITGMVFGALSLLGLIAALVWAMAS